MIIKYLKHLNKFPATYYSGRTDFLSVTVKPDETILYDSIVNTDITSVDYNYSLWDEYINNRDFTVMNIYIAPPPAPPPVWTDYQVSIFSALGQNIAWPITGASGTFTFTQGSLISGVDNSTITQTSTTITNDTLPLRVVPIVYSVNTGNYNCTLTVNGVLLAAIITVRITPN